MRKLFYGSIQSGGVRINYYRTGDDKPPVVLLHALGESALSWNRVPVALEPEFDVVLVDARGHGFSAAPASGYSPLEHAEDLLGLIHALGLKRPGLVGHGMGAVTAALAAASEPNAVRALVLEDPPWPPPPAAESERLAGEWSAYLQAGKGRRFEDLEEQFALEHPDWHSSEAFQWAKARQLANPLAAEFLKAPWPDWEATAARLTMPGLIISGEPALGAQLDEQAARQIEQIWKRAEVVRVPGAGNQVHRQQYRAFLDYARRWLRRAMASG